MSGTIRPRSRTSTFSLIAGVVCGVLVAGLLVPLAFGERLGDLGQSQATNQVDTGAFTDPGTGSSGTPLPGSTSAPLPGASAVPGVGSTGGTTGFGTTGATGTGGTTGGTGTTGAAETRRASDVGITASTIKLGIVTPDTKTLEALGYPVNPGDAKSQWQSFFDDINARGGIGGRKITAVYANTDVIDANAMRETCRKFTEDEKVFAVLSTAGFYGQPVLCIAQEHKTPFFSIDGQPAEWQTQNAPGRLFTTPQNKSRTLTNYVDWLHRTGALKGKKIGLLDIQGFDKIPVDKNLKPMLKKLGYTITSEYTFSEETQESSGQMAVAVNQMRQAGVDTILPAVNLIIGTQFVTAADGQAYRPRWYTSDFAGSAQNLYANKMPDSFDGTVGLTSFRTGEAQAGVAQSSDEANCQRIYEKSSGRKLNRSSLANVEYDSTMAACGVVQFWGAGMSTSGVNPTRATFAAAMAGLPPLAIPGIGVGGHVNQGKQDLADYARAVVWRKSCKCYIAIQGSSFTRTAY